MYAVGGQSCWSRTNRDFFAERVVRVKVQTI